MCNIGGANRFDLRMCGNGPRRTPEMVYPSFRERMRVVDASLLMRDHDEFEEITLPPSVPATSPYLPCTYTQSLNIANSVKSICALESRLRQ